MNRLEIKSRTSLEIHLNAFARILRPKGILSSSFICLVFMHFSLFILDFLRLVLVSLLLLCFPMEDVRVLRDFPKKL